MAWQVLPQHLESRIVSEISTTTALKEKGNLRHSKKIKTQRKPNLCPLEHDEQVAVVEYCDSLHIPIFAIPNGSNKSKHQANKFKLEGLRSGFPDLCVPLMRDGYGSLYIEMKRAKGSTVSPEQTAWIALLNELGHKAVICYGADEAIEVIKCYQLGAKGSTTRGV